MFLRHITATRLQLTVIVPIASHLKTTTTVLSTSHLLGAMQCSTLNVRLVTPQDVVLFMISYDVLSQPDYSKVRPSGFPVIASGNYVLLCCRPDSGNMDGAS